MMGVFVVDIKPIFLVFLISCQNDAKSTVISYIAIEAVTHLSFEFLKQNTSAAPLLLTFHFFDRSGGYAKDLVHVLIIVHLESDPDTNWFIQYREISDH